MRDKKSLAMFRDKLVSETHMGEGSEDLAAVKRNSVKQQSTANHFFGSPTESHLFTETMATGFESKKLVQPPMLSGKAKIPSDLAMVLSKQNSRTHHKTIEHHRTSTSFVNASFNDYGNGAISPLDLDTGRSPKNMSGRHSLFNKNQVNGPSP